LTQERVERGEPPSGSLTRRQVLRFGVMLGAVMGAGVLAACSSAAPAPTGGDTAPRPTTAPAAAPTTAAAAPAAAATSAPSATGPTGTLTIAQGVDAESMDPYVTTSGASKGMLWTVYDRLVIRDLDLALKPGLATSWQPLDATTWELKLRPGVTFHNGEPFDADAVKFSFARFVDPTIKNGYATLLKPVSEVQVVDPMTVRVKTTEPFAELIETLSGYVEMLPPRAAADPGAVAAKPIGTGPYRFVSWSPNDRFVVEAAGSHWSGQPYLKQVVFRPIPDPTARINELKSGGVDIITNVPPLEIGSLQNASGVSLARATNSGSIILIPSFLNTEVFQKKEVRQALQYAIDKDQLIRVVLRGEAVPMTSPFPKGVAGGYVSSLQQYPYDPDKAKALLAQAGFPDGFTVNFRAPDGRYLQDKAVAEAIAGQLAKVGIKAELETVEWSTYVQGIVGRKYELFMLSQGGLQVGPAVQTNWSSRIKGIAWQGYTNPNADQLIDRAAQQVDGAQRQATYEDLMKLAWDDSPWIYLYHQQDIYGVGNRVQNFRPTSEAVVLLGETKVSA
jgi:peptide/nickel transport system substrate-binding protein